ncbi:hypothetical protein WA158_001976 [Blastocystis sp. Blastoise]
MVETLPKKNFWILTVAIYCGMICQGWIDNAKSITGPLIRDEFNVSYSEYAIFTSSGTFGYLIFAFIGALLQERWGFKLVLILGFAGGLIGCLSTSFSNAYWLAIVTQMLATMGVGFNDIACTTLGSTIFTEHTTAHISIINFFYGVGASASPLYAGWIYNMFRDASFRGIYIGLSIPIAILFIYVIFCPFIVNYPTKEDKSENKDEKMTTGKCLRSPMVWYCSLVLMMIAMVERATTNWLGLYIEDVYGIDPGTEGSKYVTAMYVLFTLARLFGGFITDKIGNYTMMYINLVGTILLFIIGFLLKENGLWAFSCTGIFTGLFWPGCICMFIHYFGNLAPIPISIICPIQSLLQSIAQFPLGYMNDKLGAEWAYKVTPGFGVISIILVIILQCLDIKKHKKSEDSTQTALLEEQPVIESIPVIVPVTETIPATVPILTQVE